MLLPLMTLLIPKTYFSKKCNKKAPAKGENDVTLVV